MPVHHTHRFTPRFTIGEFLHGLERGGGTMRSMVGGVLADSTSSFGNRRRIHRDKW